MSSNNNNLRKRGADDMSPAASSSSSSSSDTESVESDDSWHSQSAHEDPLTLDCNSQKRQRKAAGKTVLVTGGAGFIGSHTAAVLARRGDRVIIIDEMNDYYDVTQKEDNLERLNSTFGPRLVKIYRGDICDEALMSRIFTEEKITHVVHLAARAGVRPSIRDPQLYVRSNIVGTVTLLELARVHKIKHFVFASSSSVYGGSKSTYFSEDENVDFPVSQYAATKKSTELFAATYNHLYGLNVSGLRFFTVFGPNGRPDMAPYKFVHLVATGQQMHQYGDGSSERDYTYVDDIVDGVVRCVDRPNGYQTYNLGNGTPVKLKYFIDKVQEYLGKKANIKVLPDQPGDVPRTCADISKAKKMLGYSPKISFEEGLQRTVQWYRDFKMGKPSLITA